MLPLLETIYQTFIPTIHHHSNNCNSSNSSNSNSIKSGNKPIIVVAPSSSITDDQEFEQNIIDSNLKAKLTLSCILPTPASFVESPPQVLSSISEIDLFTSFYSVLSHIHLLWELVLTAEPIVVMGDSPTSCSHMVQSLMR